MDPQNRAVVLHFGALDRIQNAGLLLAWPQPFEQVVLLPAADRVIERRVENLLRSDAAIQADRVASFATPLSDALAGSGYLLTGDAGVVQLDVRVFYKVTEPYAFVLQGAHVLPALDRLVTRSAVALTAARDLDTILVARPELIGTDNGAAERLPFADGEFDFVFSRYSAHHWSDLGLALREVRRVLKPGGVAAFVDVLSPGSPLLDTYLQTVEVLRDTSHVRDYSAAEWMRQLSEAGLHVRNSSRQRLRLEYTSWVERMRTPEVLRAAILELQKAMGQEVRDYYEVQADGTFSTDVLVVFAER
ncbi:methyltransferase domain-containing protein [Pseudomonas cedrina subsp. fulgida]|nr:methyltransferase domain-containing protein [Pseudomonas cedrina subsp. fulgida]